MLPFPNTLCCSLYERNCICAVTNFFTKFLPANNFCQLLRVTHKCSCTSAGNVQAQLHFRDDQQRAFGISNISNWDHQPFSQFPHCHHLVGHLILCDIHLTLRTWLRARRNAHAILQLHFNAVNHSNSKLSCHPVGTLISHWQSLLGN